MRRFLVLTLAVLSLGALPARAETPPPPPSIPALQDLDQLLETLMKSHPQIADFVRNTEPMRADQAVELFGRVLDRVREADPKAGAALDPKTLEQALSLMQGLAAALNSGDLQRGQLTPEMTDALSRIVPPEAVQAIGALRLQPEQIRQLQSILTEVAPKVLEGDVEGLEGPLRQRLEKVFTPEQRRVLRNAEESMKSR